MKIIGIDASINSTAICLEENNIEEYHCYTTSDKLTKWMKILEPVVNFHFISYNYPNEYSQSEVYKINNYFATSQLMMVDTTGINIVGMESYSQSSNAGRLVDLVTLGSFIRIGILNTGSDLSLYAPMTMKKEACRLAYNLTDKKGKIYRNPEGVAGGSFKKQEMLKAMVHYTRDRIGGIYDILREYSDEMLNMKSIPSPYDDIIDAFWAKEITKINKGL